MKKILLSTAAAMLISSGANAAQTFVEVPVLNVQPIQQTSEIRTPVHNCSQQLVPVDQHGNIIHSLIGGALGGLLGSQLGGGKGKLAMTGLGVLGGAAIGQNYNNNGGHRSQQVCTTSYNIQHRTRVVGYNVTYSFEGQTYTTRMSTYPKSKIRLLLNTSHTVQQ